MTSYSELIRSTLLILWYLWPVMFLALFSGALKGRGSLSRAMNRAFRTTTLLWVVFAVIWFLLSSSSQPTNSLLPESLFWIFGLILIALAIFSSVSSIFKIRGKMKSSHTIEDLQSLSPAEFEKVMAEAYLAMGYKVQHIGKLGDHGVDLLIRTDAGEKWIAQCKRWKGKVGEPVVRDFYGAMQHEQADRGLIITTGGFTPQAIEWARDKAIDLINGAELVKIIQSAKSSLGYREDQHTIPSGETGSTTSASAPSDHVPGLIEGEAPPNCPQCGVPMKLRLARQGQHQGKRFYGCPNFPKCREIIPVD